MKSLFARFLFRIEARINWTSIMVGPQSELGEITLR